MSNYSCGMQDLVSWQGMEPRYPDWELVVSATGPSGKSPGDLFFLFFFLNISSKSVCIIFSFIHSFIPQIFPDTRSNAKNLLRPWPIQEQIKDSSFLLKGTQSPGGNKMYFAFLLNNLPLLDSLTDSSMWLWGLWLIVWPERSLKSGIESSKFFCI